MNKIVNRILYLAIGLTVGVFAARFFTDDRKFDGDYNRWRKLNLILQEVGKNYVDTIDIKAMTDAAVSAALSELDPHSVYLPPVELTESDTELSGNFEGVGIVFNVPNDTAIVLSVVPGGPSEKAGIVKGDRILKVDDKVIAGVKTPQDSMVRLMKGPKGTKVRLTVKRLSEEIPFDVTRDKIPVHSIDASFMINESVGYIKLSKFTRSTHDEFVLAYAKLLEQGMEWLIFDLRDNSGGYFDQSLLLSNEFLETGNHIVYMQGRHRPRTEYKADGKGSLKDVRLSVLIDEGSASSSEIFAGAIQDNDRGVIVGRRSFGKGLVQEPIYFTDGSGIRLTVARFYTPSGRCIQKPYSKDDDYAYDIFDRYMHGEMTNADSIKVDTTSVYYTVKGRHVYGGGGIIPDVFVPIDTTLASKFYINCNKMAVQMRFATSIFDKYREELTLIEDFAALEKWMDNVNIESLFLDYAQRVEKISPAKGEWKDTRWYMMPQVKGLVGRYSKLGEEAFYRFYLPIDDTIQKALTTYDLVL